FLLYLISSCPPSTLSLHDALPILGRLALNFRSLPKRDAYHLLRWAPMPVADLAAEWFETELLRAAIEARGIFGVFAGPWSAGTRSEEHTSELQSRFDLVCRLLLEK